MAGVQKEVFLSSLQENLFEGREYLNLSVNHDAWVDNDIVHIPQAGSLPNIVKDRDMVPAPISKRTDADRTYTLSEYTTDPILVQDIEELQTNYAKRESVMRDHREALGDEISKNALFSWGVSAAADTARIVRTTGASTGALSTGASGTRKLITKEDIANLAKVFDKDNVSKSGRVLAMPSDLYYELFQIDALVRHDFMGKIALPNGVVNRLFGFDIVVIPANLPIYDDTAVPVIKAVGAATATDDNFACLAWHQGSVAKAMGSSKLYLNTDQAEYYGSIMSGLQMFGSAILRDDKKGVGAIVQAA